MDHDPVLASEVTALLAPALEHGGVFVDATLGRAGHARRILDAFPDATLIGIDRDPLALEASRANLAGYEQRVRLVSDQFKNLASVLERLGNAQVRGVLLDLGVSSPQLDDPARGFSFRSPGPLDMRMDPRQQLSADVVVNSFEQKELARVIRTYGEERFAERISKAIVATRPIHDTVELAETVKEAIPAATRRTGGHPARRTFQALRIFVNDELAGLDSVLPDALEALEPGGRLVVLSYHSLEDRAVKRFFADMSRGCVCPPDFPVCRCDAKAALRILTRKPKRPTAEEMEANPRASAAKLRAAEKLEQSA